MRYGWVELRTNVEVDRLVPGSAGTWQLLDARGCCLATAPTVVLANAHDALRLLGHPHWPVRPLRGQLSFVREPAFALPNVPIAGHGYLLPALVTNDTTTAMFGATVQRDDADPRVRAADHRHNLAQLTRLLGRPVDLEAHALSGRTAWRCSVADRLPLIGAVPDPATRSGRHERPHRVARRAGLYVYTGLGSRGIAWSALGARVLAAWVTGTPAPLEATLLDAVDPARYALADPGA